MAKGKIIATKEDALKEIENNWSYELWDLFNKNLYADKEVVTKYWDKCYIPKVEFDEEKENIRLKVNGGYNLGAISNRFSSYIKEFKNLHMDKEELVLEVCNSILEYDLLANGWNTIFDMAENIYEELLDDEGVLKILNNISNGMLYLTQDKLWKEIIKDKKNLSKAVIDDEAFIQELHYYSKVGELDVDMDIFKETQPESLVSIVYRYKMSIGDEINDAFEEKWNLSSEFSDFVMNKLKIVMQSAVIEEKDLAYREMDERKIQHDKLKEAFDFKINKLKKQREDVDIVLDKYKYISTDLILDDILPLDCRNVEEICGKDLSNRVSYSYFIEDYKGLMHSDIYYKGNGLVIAYDNYHFKRFLKRKVSLGNGKIHILCDVNDKKTKKIIKELKDADIEFFSASTNLEHNIEKGIMRFIKYVDNKSSEEK